MLPDIHRATQKFYIFLIVYLTGCTPLSLNFVTLRCGILTVTLRARFRARLSYQAEWNV